MHHLIKKNQILAIEKLIPKELYSISIVLKNKHHYVTKIFLQHFP